MARYFFNIFDGEEVFDDVGTDLDTIGDVRTYLLTIAKIWIEREEHQSATWNAEARDEDQNLVGSVRFGVEPDNGGGSH